MKIILFAGNNERNFDSLSDCLAQAEKLLNQGVAIRLIPTPELTELKGFRLDGRRFLAIDEMFTKRGRMGCLMSSYRLSKDERQAFIIEKGIFVPCLPSVHGTSLSNGFKLSEASKIQIFDKRGDIIGFEITEKSETNLTILMDTLSYQVLSEE